MFDLRANDILNYVLGRLYHQIYSCYVPVIVCCDYQPQFEGTPFYPDAGRCWDIVDKYKVTKFYTAPTAIRSLIKFGDDFVKRFVLSMSKFACRLVILK